MIYFQSNTQLTNSQEKSIKFPKRFSYIPFPNKPQKFEYFSNTLPKYVTHLNFTFIFFYFHTTFFLVLYHKKIYNLILHNSDFYI